MVDINGVSQLAVQDPRKEGRISHCAGCTMAGAPAVSGPPNNC